MRVKRKQTIKSRIFWPIIIMVSLQLVFLLFVFLFGGLMGEIDEQSRENLSDRTENQEKYIQNKMVKEWGNIENFQSRIAAQTESYLEQHSLKTEDVCRETQVAGELTAKNSKILIEMLRNTGATGAYLIFDSDTSAHSGLYLRHLEPSATAADNADFQIQVAMPKLSKKLKIPLSSYWTSNFQLDSSQYSETSFFDVPFLDAVEHPGKDVMEYAYWSGLHAVDNSGVNVISYSIPLIVDEQVIGVIGIDLTEDELLKTLQVNADYNAKDICFIFGKMNRGKVDHIEVIESCGSLYTYNFGTKKTIAAKKTKNGLYFLDNRTKNENQANACILELNIYSKNSVHYEDKWVIASCENEDTLLAYSNRVQEFIVVVMLFTLFLMVIVISFTSNRIANPIKRVIGELSHLDVSKEFYIKETEIKEIDELLGAFSKVRKMTEEYTGRLSEMIAITKLPIGLFEYNFELNVVFCSKSLFYVLGWDMEDQESMTMDGARFTEKLKEIKQNIYSAEDQIYLLSLKGEQKKWIKIHSEKDEKRSIGAIVDVTKEVLEKQKIAYERDYDVLTGMLNRRAFHQKIRDISENLQELKVGAAIMIDTDNLKYVNDTYGHEMGDRYLKKISECLKAFQEYGGICGRRSGDEFYVLLYGFQKKSQIEKIVDRIWGEMNATELELPDASCLLLRCSAGIAWYPDDGTDFEQLIKYADFAMYQVKHSSKGTCISFDREEYKKESYLLYGHKALDKLLGERLLDYAMQPILDVKAGRIYGYEMLMRSSLSEFSSPFDILKMAKSQSKLFQLEYVCWYRAMQTFSSKKRAGVLPKGCKVFVNSIGSVYLHEEEIAKLDQEFGDILEDLVLELTEEEFASEEILHSKISTTRKKNGMVAIDDFGSGYSNMTSLFHARPDIIKIDMSIIRQIDEDKERQLLFKQAVKLARVNHAKVVAEGVETKEELQCVIRLGADYIQGYYTGKPSFKIQKIGEEVLEVLGQCVLSCSDQESSLKNSC